MFTKINKKTLVISAFFLGLMLATVFLGYKYYANINSNKEPDQNLPETSLQNNAEATEKQTDVKEPESNIEVITGNGGGLTVCSDKCGDGVCQKIVPDCKDNKLNCICQEDYAECPQDCPAN